MNCEQVKPYLPGYSGGELLQETARALGHHIVSCERCRAEAGALEAVRQGLSALREHEIAPPPYLVDAVLDDVRSRRHRRLFPVPPIPPEHVLRVFQENREAILSGVGAALVAAGAAYALWRTLKAARPQAEPAR